METQFTKRTYTKSQVSLLTKSMLIAGIAFMIIGACSYGFSVLFQNTIGTNVDLGLPIFLIMLFGGMVVSMLWTANMLKQGSVPLTIGCYLLYIAMMSVAFGWVFNVATLSIDATWLPAMFAITGGIFLITTLIAQIISIRGVFTMGKIIGITGIAMSIFFFAFLITLIVVLCMGNPEGGIMATDAFCSLMMVCMSVISFLYVIIDIWQISKLSQFADMTGEQVPAIMTWFCGYKLLTDLVNVLFLVIIWMLRFARRG